jgi:RNA polymerase sigma factor (sigma-70 family)
MGNKIGKIQIFTIIGGRRLRDNKKIKRFEQSVLPHLDAAYNLARWLTRNEQDAEDVVQESYLRAFKFFEGFRGSDSRSWLLAIVRNTYYTMMQKQQHASEETPFDEELHSPDPESFDPEAILLQSHSTRLLKDAIGALPLELREVLVLRELEDLSYKEISTIAAIPMGTVMSRLARARKRLQSFLTQQMSKES